MYNREEINNYKRRSKIANLYESVKDNKDTAIKEQLTRELIQIDEFFTLCELIKEKHNIQVVLPCLLARYGLGGRQLLHIRYLQYGDINRVDKTITVHHERAGEIGPNSVLPIDDRLVQWFDENIPNWDSEEKRGVFVLGRTVSGPPLKEVTLRRYIMKFRKDSDREGLVINKLIDTRQLELLLQLRKTRFLSSRDFEESVNRFRYGNISYTAKIRLIERYEIMTGDRVVRDKYYREMHRELHEASLVDCNAYETATRLIDELNLYM